MKSIKILLTLLGLIVVHAAVAQVRITVNANKKGQPISPNLFGLFTEHIGNNVYQGAWAQVVENPEFVSADYWPVRDYDDRMEGKLQNFQETFYLPALTGEAKNGFAAYWASSGNLNGRLLNEGMHDFQQLKAGDQTGYLETGVFPPLHRTDGYEVSLTARSENQTEVILQFLNLEKTIIGEATFALNSSWQTLKKKVTLASAGHQKGDPYLLRLVVKPGTITEFSRILCFPDDHMDGWEPELVELLKKMELPLLRFPGGNFVSGYHWKDGIGPIDQRPVLPNPAWHEMEWNHVGTDEWMSLCKLIGAEPMICVNAGNGTPEEAANWVQYCNDPATTPMGRLRAKNGHEEPYNVKIWEVGNELCGDWQIGFTDGEGYARRYAAFAPELLKADSSISLIANGLIQVLEKSELISRGVDPKWNDKLMEYNGNLVRSISVHSLVGRAVDRDADPVEVWKDMVAFIENYPSFLQKLVVVPMQEANVEPKVAITELMDWPQPRSVGNVTSISGALWYSGIINTCIRSNGLVELVTRSALMNHGGGLRKERGIVYTEPVYWSHLMYASQNGTIPLDVNTTAPIFDSSGKYVIRRENMPVVDAVALMDENGSTTSVFICNRDANATQEVELNWEGFEVENHAELIVIRCNDLALRNSWDQPEKIAPLFDEISVKRNQIKYSMPPLSLMRISLISK
ncbi:alpha-L-arabinofuranosidase C-terminal domain-containing protein [Sunxiuqinia dokdonensis]|uniref:non-reducing end alpha-L-arabinofuranosidase n=1 Tax=Sunxiuqinia dokdonensis TaxID=1409788 RepID=A0A0L8VCS4_9BACT|nr:alpha-L-arabinofuranosidase C-terminal domain-containing protein [Sunxiuqinia dokdonensis]KOH46275.1 non-reducing end alpha-L-arabinofuranosidase [Sunxiuqinia dokdonensis]